MMKFNMPKLEAGYYVKTRFNEGILIPRLEGRDLKLYIYNQNMQSLGDVNYSYIEDIYGYPHTSELFTTTNRANLWHNPQTLLVEAFDKYCEQFDACCTGCPYCNTDISCEMLFGYDYGRGTLATESRKVEE